MISQIKQRQYYRWANKKLDKQLGIWGYGKWGNKGLKITQSGHHYYPTSLSPLSLPLSPSPSPSLPLSLPPLSLSLSLYLSPPSLSIYLHVMQCWGYRVFLSHMNISPWLFHPVKILFSRLNNGIFQHRTQYITTGLYRLHKLLTCRDTIDSGRLSVWRMRMCVGDTIRIHDSLISVAKRHLHSNQ